MVDAAYTSLDTIPIENKVKFPPQLGYFRNTPYPPENLLAVYLPGWLTTFLNDLWTEEVNTKNFYIVPTSLREVSFDF